MRLTTARRVRSASLCTGPEQANLMTLHKVAGGGA
jgi:hypothetical protein